jgi:hypothetical protein
MMRAWLKALFADHSVKVPPPVDHEQWEKDYERRKERVESLERAVNGNFLTNRLFAPRQRPPRPRGSHQ